jgi:hypothetical protein
MHPGLPLSYSADAPAYWFGIPASERDRRSILGEEQGVIDGEQFFIRARLCLPVLDGDDAFEWGVWVSLSEANFQKMSAFWERRGRENEPPMFGWLSTLLPYSPPTMNLKTTVYMRPVGERPVVMLEPTTHPLSIEQQHGITMRRVQEIAETILHSEE